MKCQLPLPVIQIIDRGSDKPRFQYTYLDTRILKCSLSKHHVKEKDRLPWLRINPLVYHKCKLRLIYLEWKFVKHQHLFSRFTDIV